MLSGMAIARSFWMKGGKPVSRWEGGDEGWMDE